MPQAICGWRGEESPHGPRLGDPRAQQRSPEPTTERIGAGDIDDRDIDDDKGQERSDREFEPEELARRARENTDRIRQYLLDRQSRREVILTTQTRLGQSIDWVPAESLAPEGKIASPPEADRLDLRMHQDPADGKEVRPAEFVRFELEDERAERGPSGTVPIVRRDVDRITSTKYLQDFLSKHGRATQLRPEGEGVELALPEDGSVHKYANTAQGVTAYGTEGNINAWDPYLEWSDEFSLGQNALVRGTGSGRQTIESGHQEYRDLYGDWVPHLFVFYTTNNYSDQGDNKGGYNQDVDGWVQYSNVVYPEALSSPLSTFGGTQYIMNLKWQLWQGNWWMRCNNRWIGYYPASLFSASGCATRPTRWRGTARSSTATATPAPPRPTWATATGPTRAGSIART